jgi:hypothetical protein
MSEALFSASWQSLCDQLLSIRKSRDWKRTHSTFDDYVVDVWAISKSRAKLLCHYSIFCRMCRDEFLRIPASPDVIAPLLKLPQGRWLDTWRMCIDYNVRTAKSMTALFENFGIGGNKRTPQWVLNGHRVRKAAKTLAELGDGGKLVDEIGAKGLGRDWDAAVSVVIDADTARMDERG